MTRSFVPPPGDAFRGPWGPRPGAPRDDRVLFYAEHVPDVVVSFAILAVILGAPVAFVALELVVAVAVAAAGVAWAHLRAVRFEVTPTHVRVRRALFAAAELIPLDRVRWAVGGPLDPRVRRGLEILEIGVAEEAGRIRRLALVGIREASEAAAAVLAIRDGRVAVPAA